MAVPSHVRDVLSLLPQWAAPSSSASATRRDPVSPLAALAMVVVCILIGLGVAEALSQEYSTRSSDKAGAAATWWWRRADVDIWISCVP